MSIKPAPVQTMFPLNRSDAPSQALKGRDDSHWQEIKASAPSWFRGLLHLEEQVRRQMKFVHVLPYAKSPHQAIRQVVLSRTATIRRSYSDFSQPLRRPGHANAANFILMKQQHDLKRTARHYNSRAMVDQPACISSNHRS
jgi:hypothetical protein